MIRIKLTYILLSGFLLLQCSSNDINENWCNNSKEKTANLIYNYQMTNDTLYLDTALVYTDSALKICDELKTIFTFRKLDILTKKRDYSKAIAFINSHNDPIFIDLPYYNKYLLNRYKAMQSHLKGKNKDRDDHIKANISILQEFIMQHQQKIDSIYQLKSSEEIYKDPLSFVPVQYYYSKSILYGYDRIEAELDSLYSIKKINKDYIDFIYTSLENDFLDFVGF